MNDRLGLRVLRLSWHISSLLFSIRLGDFRDVWERTSSNGVRKLDHGIALRQWTKCCWCLGGVHTVKDAGTGLSDARSTDSSVALYVWYECVNDDGEIVITA